jgi:SAM-dependent methyltransferase
LGLIWKNQEIRLSVEETSFDCSIVRYEEIHSIAPDDFKFLAESATIESGNRILDCGCGYGAVTREVLRSSVGQDSLGVRHLSIDLIDESHVQLERAKSELQEWSGIAGIKLEFLCGSFPEDIPPSVPRYDLIFCKMVLHEIPVDKQLSFVTSIYGHLAESGDFVFWDVCLSEEIAEFYRAAVRQKDLLAGYTTMAERRNFLTEKGMGDLFLSSPFRQVQILKNIKYRFDTLKRLIPEFANDLARFEEWQRFIRQAAKSLSPQIMNGLNYEDTGDTIRFDVRKVIARATRKRAIP